MNEKRTKMGFCIVFCLAITLLLVGCGFAAEGADGVEATPTPLPTPVVPEKPSYTVEKGTVVNTLEFTGRISPVLEQELFFKSDGFVADVFTSRGDEVQEGDLLAELEIGDLQNQLAQQEVALKTAELNLAKAEQDIADQLLEAVTNLEKLKLQLEQDQAGGGSARVTSAQVGAQAAQRELEAAQEAYDNAWDEGRDWEGYMRDPSCLPGQGGAVPCTGEPLHDRLERDRESSEARLAAAKDSLRVAQAEAGEAYASSNASGFSALILEKDIELAEQRIERLERGVDPLLALDVERAQLEIDDTRRRMDEARLVAPFSGQILSMNVRPGDGANAFKTVIVQADPNDLEVTAELGGEDLAEMSIGQEATITLRSRPEESFNGFIRQLPYPYGGGTVETDEDDTAVRIVFEDPGIELELGELATVVLLLEEKENALWLPPAALRSFQGRTFVVIQEADGSQRRADVRSGIESVDKVEILEGLTDGQTIIGE